MNLQVIASSGGDLLWVSGTLPGSMHDKKAEWIWGVLDELEKAGLVTLADKGYQGGTWAKVPYKEGTTGSVKEASRAHAKLRAPEKGRTRSSRHGESFANYAAPLVRRELARPSSYYSSARPNQDGKRSLRLMLYLVSPVQLWPSFRPASHGTDTVS
jgi:DDE superfamily endonuclease